MSQFATRTEVPEGADVTHVAYLRRPDDTAHASGDFTTYTFTVYDDEGVAIYTPPAAIAVSNGSPVYDTLQTDGYWKGRNSTGYNFRATLTQATLVANAYEGGRTYRVVYELNGGSTYGTVPVTFYDVSISP